MKYYHVLRKLICMLLVLSLLFCMGTVVFAADGDTEDHDLSSGFQSDHRLTDGGDNDPDTFTIDMDALLRGEVLTETVMKPMDVAIVFDRSDSMSFPADASEIRQFSSYSELQAFLNTLDRTVWDGYYRVSNLSETGQRFYSLAQSTGHKYMSWEALRYNKSTGNWETFVTTYANNVYDSSGYPIEDPHGIIQLSSHGFSGYYGYWRTMKEAFNTFQNRKNANSFAKNDSSVRFSIAIPKLTKAQIALEQLIYELNVSADNLPEGMYHTLSVTGYGRSVFKNGYTYSGSNSTLNGKVFYDSYDGQEYAMRCSSPSIQLAGSRASSVQTATLKTFVNDIIKSQYVFRESRTDLAMQEMADKNYLPANTDGRERVVIVLTDGTPTTTMNFETAVANSAISAAKKLKDDGVKIYTLSCSENFNPASGIYSFTSNLTEEQKAHDFLHLLSSNYPNATSMTSIGSRGTGNYWIAGHNAGEQLAASVTEEGKETFTTLETPLAEGESVATFEELSSRFMIDDSKMAKVYIQEYKGNGTFGDKIYIGENLLSLDQNTLLSDAGLYRLYWDCELTTEQGETVSTVGLNWIDAKNGAIRETPYTVADSAYPQFTMGYKIGLELPVKVDRDQTMGGSNIPVNGETSGLYLSLTEDVPNHGNMTTAIVTYPILKTDVEKHLDVQIGHTLDLASDISVNYAVLTQWMEGFDSGYLEVSFSRGTYKLEPEIRGEYCYFTLDGITAVDMSEILSAELHVFLDGEEFVSETDRYSVTEYAYKQFSSTRATEELKALCANLLRYGSLAQSYKGSTNVLPDAEMTAEQKTYLTDLGTVSVVSTAKALGDVENGVAWAGKSLVLDSKVAVKAIFDLKNYTGNMEALNLRVSYVNGKGKEVTAIVEDGELYSSERNFYAFTVDTLLAMDMRCELTMALYEGDTQVSETQVYSVESYCASRTGVLAELGKTLLAYSDAVKAYFVK